MADLLPTGIPISKTYKADGSLATYRYRIVKLSAAGKVALGTAGCKCHGVLQDDNAAAGYNASVVTRGETPVYVDATTAIAVGDRIMCGASGAGVKVPTTAATKSEYLGTALEAKASGTGTIIVDVDPGVQTTPAA